MRIGWQIADLSLSLGMSEDKGRAQTPERSDVPYANVFLEGEKNSPNKSCLSGETVLPLYQIKVYENSIHTRIHRTSCLGG